MAREMTKKLHDALMIDLGIGMAAVVDFGIGYSGSQNHSALQRAVRAGATVEELDEALGNGPKISALVKKYTDIDIPFSTPYDSMREAYQETIDELTAKDSLTEDEQEELEDAQMMITRL
jgi:hypothetical protein